MPRLELSAAQMTLVIIATGVFVEQQEVLKGCGVVPTDLVLQSIEHPDSEQDDPRSGTVLFLDQKHQARYSMVIRNIRREDNIYSYDADLTRLTC